MASTSMGASLVTVTCPLERSTWTSVTPGIWATSPRTAPTQCSQVIPVTVYVFVATSHSSCPSAAYPAALPSKPTIPPHGIEAGESHAPHYRALRTSRHDPRGPGTRDRPPHRSVP